MKQTPALNALTRKSGMDPLVSVGLAVVFVFFLVSGGVAYLNIQTLREDNQRIVHSLQVITTLDGLLSTVKDAETGQRGFLLTDNERYLEPYNAALPAVTSQLDDLSQLMRDNPNQQDRIGPLKQHIEAKLAELKETIDLRRSQGAEAALAVVTTDRGKVEMDTIRAQLAAIQTFRLGRPMRSWPMIRMGRYSSIRVMAITLAILPNIDPAARMRDGRL